MKRRSQNGIQKLHIILIFIIEKAFCNQELQVTKVQNSSHASQRDVVTLEMLELWGKVLNRNAAKDEDKWNSTSSVMEPKHEPEHRHQSS